MAGQKPKSREPQPLTYRSVPKELGAGRVCLYDARGGLPDLLDPPFPNLLKGMPWVLVHFPSRRQVLVKSKAKGIAYLKAIAKGEDETGVVPKVEKKAKASKPDKKSAKPESGTASHVRARASNVEPAAEPPKEHEKPDLPDSGATPVPPGMTFDQAMQHVFPPQRLTAELERLLRATTEVFTKEGDSAGFQEAHMVQLQAAKTIISYHQGRPPEKEKPAPEKPKVTYEELEKMIMTSEAAQEMMQRLLDKARADKAVPVGDVTNPAPPAP